LINARFFYRSVLSREGLLGNPFILLSIGIILMFQGLFTYAGPMETLFGTAPLSLWDWVRIDTIGLGIFLIVELEKAVLRKFFMEKIQLSSAKC
jgi:magnesium-transporting ATPase (P-type)